ncbi:hypothetical protein AAHA92_19678 [Salvia divinorum]|uniref:Uncharacterized protein n=1 Tax=Salvia divinorum TaxID=28513 RepID=A0ABD1GHS8_SALDI
MEEDTVEVPVVDMEEVKKEGTTEDMKVVAKEEGMVVDMMEVWVVDMEVAKEEGMVVDMEVEKEVMKQCMAPAEINQFTIR